MTPPLTTRVYFFLNKRSDIARLTLISLRLVSVSYTTLPPSVLPLRDEVPPSDANVAAERPGVAQREDGWGGNTRVLRNTILGNTTPDLVIEAPSCESTRELEVLLTLMKPTVLLDELHEYRLRPNKKKIKEILFWKLLLISLPKFPASKFLKCNHL